MIRYGYSSSPLRTNTAIASILTIKNAHAEAWRRIRAMISDCPYKDAQGHSLLGVGTAWRSAAQQGAGGSNHAGLWRSWHQGRSQADDRDAVAFDLVDWTTGIAQGDGAAIRWANANCHKYGLVHFRNVNREPWHHQVSEVTTARSYMQMIPYTLPFISLPGVTAPVIPVDPGPAVRAGVPRPTLRRGDFGPEAFEWINVSKFWGWYPEQWINDVNDGKIGARGEQAIINMQRTFGITADGIYGPKSAQVLSNFLDAMDALKPQPVPTPVPDEYTYYIVQQRDGWYKVATATSTNVDDLVKVNRTAINAMIHPGDRLAIPGRSIKVISGDGWERLANVAGVPVSQLYAANNSSVKTQIHPGQIVLTK